ncbi:hypothetical protein MNBD_GAMMA16-2147 [hydrothermal vent metagenome]|uniref:GAD-like domain protein n=1 Tax=hydrothermal vent metagenome TaxID=652676 RepID=A0A3B0ZD24_9ZZZZ
MELNEDFQDVLEDFGEPTTYDKPQSSELDAWSRHIPEPLVDFWHTYGWSSFLKGRLWSPNPHDFDPLMEVIFEDDPEIDHKKCHLVAYSAFGSLSIWSEQFQIIRVSLVQGWIFVPGITDNELADDPNKQATFPFSGDAKTSYDSMDENGKRLFSRAVKKYGSLEPGECFGFFPAHVLGGGGNLNDIQRVKALEHFILLAELQPLTLMKWEGTTMVPVRQIGT